MGKILEVIELGNPILRKVSKKVKSIDSKDVQKLIDDLITTTIHTKGVGLAAPQVSHLLRIFIMYSRPNPRYPKAPLMKHPTEVINPQVHDYSDEIEEGWEGCLSIPGIRGLVPRHKSIKISYFDRKKINLTRNYSGFIARIFQHELDHLNGIVFLDRIKNTKNIITEKEYLKLFTK